MPYEPIRIAEKEEIRRLLRTHMAFYLVLVLVTYGFYRRSRSLASALYQASRALEMDNVELRRTKGMLATYAKELEESQKKLEESNDRLAYIASYDSLTGLLNRRALARLLQNETKEAKEHARSCILIVDIDAFKQVNDRYGHPIGDGLLQDVARKLKEWVREVDLVSRWGGEEFLIFLDKVKGEEGYKIAEELRRKVMAYTFQIGGHTIQITVSIGVAEFVYDHANPLDASYQKADRALYQAKNQGRNQCVLEA